MSKKNKRPAGMAADPRADEQRANTERTAPGSTDPQARRREKSERDPFADNGEFDDPMAEAERQESQNSARQW